MIGSDYGVVNIDNELRVVVKENNNMILDENGVVVPSPFYYATDSIHRSNLVVIDGRVYVRWHMDDAAELDDIDDIRGQERDGPLFGCYMVVDVDGELGFAIQTHSRNAYAFDEDGESQVDAMVVFSLDNKRWKHMSIREFDNGTVDLVYDTGYYYCTAQETFIHENDYNDVVGRPTCCRGNGTWNIGGEWIEFVEHRDPVIDDSEPVSTDSEMDWLESMAKDGE